MIPTSTTQYAYPEITNVSSKMYSFICHTPTASRHRDHAGRPVRSKNVERYDRQWHSPPRKCGESNNHTRQLQLTNKHNTNTGTHTHRSPKHTVDSVLSRDEWRPTQVLHHNTHNTRPTTRANTASFARGILGGRGLQLTEQCRGRRGPK
jgi:hypothetical protein